MSTPDTPAGRAVLTLAHVIGMIDMVALPLWVGALMQHHRFPPAQAGLTVTLFMLGALVASVISARLFNRLAHRLATSCGFGLAAASFALASYWPMAPESFAAVALCHASAGFGVGTALSFTHGCIGRSANPHRMFGLVNAAMGLFALLFLGIMPGWIAKGGSTFLFEIFAALMAFVALVSFVAFPKVPRADTATARESSAQVPAAARLLIGVVICLTLTQAMVFSFMERIGIAHGFGAEKVHGVLIVMGLVNLLPGLLAAWWQRRISSVAVGAAGPMVQAALALTLSNSATFWPYAVASSLFVSVVIFTHTFLFGLMNRLDSTGRAAAATPAMTMAGSCIGPALGGVVVQTAGYAGLGAVACAMALLAVALMSQVRSQMRHRATLAGAQA
ncbi:MFS transporter [Paraburkholderia kururiensis]|uniref:MFS transporter n=1 Tax=Paraburkholderia kururiensis TaxID=984307 RepID=UPI000F89B317|nr:MFS transporter [Paraburkholderia kururiensis]